MRLFLLILLALILLGGCLPLQLVDPSLQEEKTVLVPSSPFSSPGPVSMSLPPKVTGEPANKETALRVHTVGRQLLTANPEIGMKPLFATYGAERPELFHVTGQMGPLPEEQLKNTRADGRFVYITEGMVQRCKTDGELAALLAHELAQMVVEREVLANPAMRRPQERPPIDVMIGSGVNRGEFDHVRQAELARFEQKRQAESRQPLPIPDPGKLARHYLEKAGYAADDLDAVAPLLDEAERNYLLERQFKQSPENKANWTALPR